MATRKKKTEPERKPDRATPGRKAASARKSAPTRARSPRRSAEEFPDRLFAVASPCSVGGVSLFEPGYVAEAETVANFASEHDVVQRAVYLLQDAGFEVLQANNLMINIAGSRVTYERAFNTSLTMETRPTLKEGGRQDGAEFFDSPETPVSGLISTEGTRFQQVLEGVALEEPRYLMQSAFPPPARYWHLDVPADVSLGCNADLAHRDGITGRGIRVAMVDSGWFRHPFFVQRGYRAAPVVLGPGTANPLADESGHGTGESANVFAVAPDVELLPVKAMLAGALGNVLVNSTAAFNAAVALRPHIITCSWAFSIQSGPLSAAQQALAAAVAAAVANGIVVVFSAGNGHFGFPGQHPDVISAGGVFMDRDGSMRASDYSSGFMSNVYPGRRVPDLSGLVGMAPGAQYIMLPVQGGDQLDVQLSGGTHPNGDETANNDGWAAFSGTSASAPQIAGAAALVLQACPRLTPAEVKDILMRTARDVTTGTNAMGNAAVAGPDTATGNGLVDATRAVLLAKLRCLSVPLQPLLPIRPLLPLQPLLPLTPVRPLLPLSPLQPLTPVRPLLPIQPLLPLTPVRPLLPVQPLFPLQPLRPIDVLPIRPLLPQEMSAQMAVPRGGELSEAAPAGEAQGGAQDAGSPLTPENIRMLEDMILGGDRDII